MNANLTPEQQALLAQLQDIHLPATIGWWPPSQTLIGLVVGLGGIAIGLLWYYLKQKKINRYRQEALATFDSQISQQPDNIETLKQANQLLKQVAITQYGRTRVAALSNTEWCQFLHDTALYLTQPEILAQTLAMIYQPPNTAQQPHSKTQIQAALTYMRQWIKGHHQ